MAYLSVCEVAISRDIEFVFREKKRELVCVRSNLIDLNIRVFVFFSLVEYLFKHNQTPSINSADRPLDRNRIPHVDYCIRTFLRSYNWYQSGYHSTRDVEIQQ